MINRCPTCKRSLPAGAKPMKSVSILGVAVDVTVDQAQRLQAWFLHGDEELIRRTISHVFTITQYQDISDADVRRRIINVLLGECPLIKKEG